MADMKDSPITWLASCFAVVGAILVATKFTGSKYGFILFLVASATYGVVAFRAKVYSLASIEVLFTIINIFAIWRWFS